MEELKGISYPETCLISSFLPVKVESPLLWESYSITSLGPIIQQAVPTNLGTEISTWTQRASD